jgi:hypothetical protein
LDSKSKSLLSVLPIDTFYISLEMKYVRKYCFRNLRHVSLALICTIILCRPWLIAAQTIADEEQGHSLQSILGNSNLSVLKVARRRQIANAAAKPVTELIALATFAATRLVIENARPFSPKRIVGFPLASNLPSAFAPRAPPV